MRVYFSGISGTGIGPLAELAQDAGYEVFGSDLQRGAISDELDERGILVAYGAQDGELLRKLHAEQPIDWLVHTSAMPKDAVELKIAAELGIHTSKRDEFIADLIERKQLKMIAVAGTHGKTTTTAMIAWTFARLGRPVNYLVGTTLPWGNGGHFDEAAEYFVYEADEYDRNFLAYKPYIAAITCVDYDHPDIYPTRAEYVAAFEQFKGQSTQVIEEVARDERIMLVGDLRKVDGSLALATLETALPEIAPAKIVEAINAFPGAGRRFEEIANGVYSDYGHHPSEIKTTVAMAQELKQLEGFAGLAVVYQPHQNSRQHEVYAEYADAFVGADRVFWAPTYLTRENPDLEVLTPEFFREQLSNKEVCETCELNEALAQTLRDLRAQNWLILLMSAGPADAWLRSIF